MDEIARFVDTYQQMGEALKRLEKRAIALAEVHGLEVSTEDFAPATGSVEKPSYHQLPIEKYELFDPNRKPDNAEW